MILRGLLFAALAFTSVACAQSSVSDQWELVEAQSRPHALAEGITLGQAFGELTYAGGVELVAPKVGRFGGFSGMAVDESGELTAVSDSGAWMRAKLVFDADTGALTSAGDIRMAAMRDEAGAPFQTKRDGDAEDLATLPDGRFAVSFEQRHRVLLYDLNGRGPFGAAELGPALGGTQGMHPNEGLEGLAALADGALVGAAEYAPNGPGSPFWILPLDAKEPVLPAGRAERPQGFGIVGLTRLPNGDLLAIERFFLPLIGVRINVRWIEASSLKGAPPRLDGRILAALEPPLRLDNFESVAAVARPDGKIRLFLLSDNNFSRNQKTLLYAFDWAAPAHVLVAATPPVVKTAAAPKPETPLAAVEAAAVAAIAAIRGETKPKPPKKVAESEKRASAPVKAAPPRPKPAPKPAAKPVEPTPEPAPAPPPPPRPVQGPEE